jgi:hypothetical protein
MAEGGNVGTASCRIVHPGGDFAIAARELASYVERMTGIRPVLIDDPAPIELEAVYVIGPATANPLTREIDESLGGAMSQALTADEAFVVWPLEHDGRPHVVIAGKNAAATLSAAYAYLERFCHVGFFQDGDRVPKTSPAFDGEPLISAPRFRDRKGPACLGGGHWGLKKFYTRFWTPNEIRAEIDWMVKRRLNMMVVSLGVQAGSTDHLAREVCADLGYPLDPPTESVQHVSGFPVTWSWPPEYSAGVLRDAISYGRRLGIRFIYAIGLGEVPIAFKAKYPRLRYVEDKGVVSEVRWDHAQVHPDDPFYKEFTSAYLRKLIDAFGTDHLYAGAPYGETSPEATIEESFELKKKASLRFLELLRDVDPDATWVTDSWDFFWSRETWTPARVKQYLDAMPADAFYIYDTNADNRGVPVYEEHGHFHGKDWAFGVMHSAAQHDQIHGDLRLLHERVTHAAASPEASKCRGVFLVPELTNYNVMLHDFLTRETWDPAQVDPDQFLDDFALRRYGPESASAIRRALHDIASALYTREINAPVYNLGILKWIWHNTPPWIQLHTIPLLSRALRAFAHESANQIDNLLYENDLVDLAKAYLAEIAAWHFHQANAAYAAGDGDALRRSAGCCLGCIEWIARILSTRADRSLAVMIDEVMRVPGTNPNTPRMILQGTINWDYCSNDSYEQVANYYLPQMADYFRTIQTRIAAGSPPIDLKTLVDALSPTHEDWIAGPRTLSRTVTFEGTALDAILAALRSVEPTIPEHVLMGATTRAGGDAVWRGDLARADLWEVAMPAIRLDDGIISTDPAFGPVGSYMHKEWVDMPVWGTVRTSSAAGLSTVDLRKTPLLTIRYRIEEGRDPVHLWANWEGRSGEAHRARVWRSFLPVGERGTDTLDLLLALRSRGDDPRAIRSLEFGLQRHPHAVRIDALEISG